MSTQTNEEILEKLLANRGAKTKTAREDFLNPKYENLGDPLLLSDVKPAIKRVKSAVENKEKIFIYGDYDVDGITATTLLMDAFSSFGVEAKYYMPDRFSEGYGLSETGIRFIADQGGQLIITVDCGSKSHEEIALANKLGIDVIVTDHHSLGDTLPECVAVINPKRDDSKYPFNDLAGVGVAFTLVRALQGELDGLAEGQEKWLLDLVALGTTCDVVSMTEENRILVKWGLEVAKKSRRPAFKALSEVSNTEQDSLRSEDFGFRFGPRLNAAGRLESAELSLELMLSANISEARQVATKLNDQNSSRRTIQRKIMSEASEKAEGSKDAVLVLADKDWSQGVVGIVAAKMVEKYKKPAFIMQNLEDKTKGSARSYGDFNLAKAIESVNEVVITGGGHALAAGVTIETKNLDEFRQRINKYYEDLELGDQSQLLDAHGEVTFGDLGNADLDLIEQLSALEPFGKDNEPPLFEAKLSVVEAKNVGADQSHLRIVVADDEGNTISGIGFSLAKDYAHESKEVDLVFELQKNEFNGQISPQIVVKQIRTISKK